MIIGSGINGVGGTAFLYRSLDLRQWHYIAPLCIGDMSQTGQMWECPDFFPLGGKHVLMISALPAGKVLYLTGAYAGNVFVPDKQGIADDGCFYAPLSMTDSTGRRLMWGWLREERSQAAQGCRLVGRDVTPARPGSCARWNVERRAGSRNRVPARPAVSPGTS